MENKKIKWLIYTVLVALIPILSRFIVWLVTTRGTVSIIIESDFIIFGLILHISNINEIENMIEIDKTWRTVQNGTSIVFIAFYSILFALSIVGSSPNNSIDLIAVKYSSIILSLISFFICFSVYHKISKSVGTN